ncbi:unnamed protein product [Brugia pahangi]|uniref:Secreted protein n=1 Tax=Brugia pahangi TaxID=6280 RepID=A0A0N4T0Z7_BRUPA|nr:unnamed protein product [Brugia pahangi]
MLRWNLFFFCVVIPAVIPVEYDRLMNNIDNIADKKDIGDMIDFRNCMSKYSFGSCDSDVSNSDNGADNDDDDDDDDDDGGDK